MGKSSGNKVIIMGFSIGVIKIKIIIIKNPPPIELVSLESC